jgi:hypothetical protein
MKAKFGNTKVSNPKLEVKKTEEKLKPDLLIRKDGQWDGKMLYWSFWLSLGFC